MRRKIWAIVAIACLFSITSGVALRNTNYTHNEKDSVTGGDSSVTTLHLWYTDESMADYLSSAALAFYEKTGVRVTTEYQTGLEYIEEINDASLHSDNIPDVYLVSNDSLEKAYLTGLASEVTDQNGHVNNENFPQTAIHAVTYKGKVVAYPMYFETSALIYNKTYLEQIAEKLIEAEDDKAAGEAAQKEAEQNQGQDSTENTTVEETVDDLEWKARVENKMAEMIPESMDEILAMADEYDMAEGMEGYLLWDVSDIFYNYFFLGNYIVVGGEDGDDINQVNILNSQSIDCLSVYQRLNQFFSIDAETSNYSKVIQDFIDGKYLFTIATTDVLQTLENAKAEGSFEYEYGVTVIPAVSDGSYFVEEYVEDEEGNAIEGEAGDVTVRTIGELDSRGLSVTYGVAVNGYSVHQEEANAFADFLSSGYLNTLYARTGKMACSYHVTYDEPAFSGFVEEYEKSISMPKVTELANFWLQLEVCFTKVWEGESTSEQLRSVSDQITLQIAPNE